MQAMVLSGKKRALEGDPQYEPCCNKYTEHTLKDSNLDVKVKGLLVMHAGLKPEPMWRLLCCHGYHTTRKEITNFRDREKNKAKKKVTSATASVVDKRKKAAVVEVVEEVEVVEVVVAVVVV